jgi:hypothetical protein
MPEMPQFGNSGDKIWQAVVVARRMVAVVGERRRSTAGHFGLTKPQTDEQRGALPDIVVVVSRPAML